MPVLKTAEIRIEACKAGRPFVLAHGCFDIFHVGHLLHLRAAARLGRLFVSITDDPFVSKGAGRPIFSAAKRAALIAELRCVHAVFVTDGAVAAITCLSPDVYVKGPDYHGGNLPEGSEVRIHGGSIAILMTERFSTTDILKRLQHPEEVEPL